MALGEILFQPLNVLCLLIFLSHKSTAIGFPSASGNATIKCIQKERQILLRLKQHLEDDFDLLSSWGSEENKRDCCKWREVKCNNHTGHVVALDLPRDSDNIAYKPLRGKVGPSLLEFEHLNYLDLSDNEFLGTPIPKFIGSLSSLQYLNLSATGFFGLAPDQLGNLSNLRTLDLSRNYSLSINNLEWISRISSLRYISLSHVDLSYATDWLHSVNKLPLHKELRLGWCGLPVTSPFSFLLTNISTSSLSSIDLSGNFLKSPSRYHWLFNLSSSLIDVNLSENELEGLIPGAFGEMISLKHLDLSINQLDGGVPKAFWNLSNLRSLDLSLKNLSAQLPENFLNLSGQLEYSLQMLILSGNKLKGPLPDVKSFSSLRELLLFDNLLNGSIPESFVQLPHLEILALVGLRGSPVKSLPAAALGLIQQLTTLTSIQLGFLLFNWIWFWDLSPKLELLNLFHNSLGGELPDLSLKFGKFPRLDLSSINFTGLIPEFPSSLTSLIHSKNKFQGPMSFMCRSSDSLSILDLSDNFLSGQLPDCWMHFKQLAILNLANNHFHGNIPKSVGSLSQVQALHLRNNGFSGELPNSLKQCTLLRIIDLGKNRLTGKLPEWKGIAYQTWLFLVSEGSLNSTITHSYYYASGGSRKYDHTSYADSALLLWKGIEFKYKNTLGLVRSIDLSSRLSGEIPTEVASLVGLIALNLSRNNLTGRIPAKIGELKLKIPSSTQLQSFNASAYAGNLGLCGLPLANICSEDQCCRVPTIKDDSDDEAFISTGFYASAALGFVIGFWGVCGPLLLNSSWAFAYYRFMDNIKNWFIVTPVIIMAKLKKWFLG
ncbi:hypothetical protein RND71_038394 [Anisodus tanguticus]|uniref:Leucine-rich repeat-containing N-terminal plant-type domain-containing protein n=1 Tax=Anisodus tanguticus TaxID=243964 RepID=A0AAE1US31_9SOLA|nr:hypothetical protein RND71_038394 [Anisodus tanguticus]